MTSKTKERIALEEDAREIGVSFAPNIGDEKLAERVAEAQAKAAAKRGGQPGGDETDAGTGAEAQDGAAASIENTKGAVQDTQMSESPTQPAQPEQPAQATAAEGQDMSLGSTSGGQDEDAQDEDEGAGPTVTVICHRPDGRRRGGRRWDSGPTTVPVAVLTGRQLAELEADPLFTVTRADA